MGLRYDIPAELLDNRDDFTWHWSVGWSSNIYSLILHLVHGSKPSATCDWNPQRSNVRKSFPWVHNFVSARSSWHWFGSELYSMCYQNSPIPLLFHHLQAVSIFHFLLPMYRLQALPCTELNICKVLRVLELWDRRVKFIFQKSNNCRQFQLKSLELLRNDKYNIFSQHTVSKQSWKKIIPSGERQMFIW